MTNIISQMSYCLNMVVSEKNIPHTLVQKECFPLYELHLIECFFGLPSGGNLPKKKKLLGYIIPFFDAFTISSVHNT